MKLLALFGAEINHNTRTSILNFVRNGYTIFALDTQAILFAVRNNYPYVCIDYWLDRETIYRCSVAAHKFGRLWFQKESTSFTSDGICWPDLDRGAMTWFWQETTIAAVFMELFLKQRGKDIRCVSDFKRIPSLFYYRADTWRAIVNTYIDRYRYKSNCNSKNDSDSMFQNVTKLAGNIDMLDPVVIDAWENNQLAHIPDYKFVDFINCKFQRNKIILALNAGELYRFTPVIENLAIHFKHKIKLYLLQSNENLALEWERKLQIPVLPGPKIQSINTHLQEQFYQTYLKTRENSSGEPWHIFMNIDYHFEYYCKGRWPGLAATMEGWSKLWMYEKPEAVITSSLLDAESQLPAIPANRNGIITFSLPHSRLQRIINVINGRYILYDVIPLKSSLEKMNITPDRLIACSDIIGDYSYPSKIKNDIQNIIDNTKFKILVLVGSTYWLYIDSNLIKPHSLPSKQIEAIQAIANPPETLRNLVQIKFKLPPVCPEIEVFEIANINKDQYLLPSGTDLLDALDASDLVIDLNNASLSAAIHCIQRNKPLLFWWNGVIKSPDANTEILLEAGEQISTNHELWNVVHLAIRNPKYLKSLVCKVTKFNKKYLDRTNFPSIVKVIEDKLSYEIKKTEKLNEKTAVNKSTINNILNTYKGHNLVFVVGCPRSGTTWLQRLLACHPKIRSGQESDIFDMFIGPQLRAWRSLLNYKLSRRPVGLTSYLRETEYLSALRQYMMNLIEPMIGNLQKDEIFVEKTPSHALYIPEIIEMLPESRIIHILRDVRDVVASLLAASKSWGNYWAPKDAEAATQMWVQHVRAVRESARNLPGSQFFELYYEELSAATENVLRDLCMFLGLEWDEKGIAAAIENNRLEIAKKTAGTVIPVGGELASLLGPITKEPEGFVRKGRPGSWKEDLSEQELLLISQVAGNTMEEVGYGWNDPEELQSCTKKSMGYYVRRIENNVESLVTIIKKLRDDGYLEKAAFGTEQALKKYPRSLDLHNLKAELKIQKGNINEGKQILLELIKYFPDNIEALNNLGIVSVYEENLNSALEFFMYVLILDPDNKVALENLSHIGGKCSISDNLHFKSSGIISKNIYKNAYQLHNFRNIPKELRQSYYDHTKAPLSNIDYYRALRDRLVSLNIVVEEREIDINDFEQWLNEFPEIKNHYQNYGDVFIEKCLEHYVTYRYLNISQNDIFIDIAASGSPWADVLNFRGIRSYRLDMAYPKGLNGINIGADACNSGLPDGFCSTLALHCAFECFMGDADIRFAKEATRILKKNGRYAIAPLYLEDTYFVSTSPLCDQKNITIEKEALKVWRDDEYKVPFDRFYSPESFKQRIYSRIPENMNAKVIYFKNLENLNKHYKGQRIYCFFMFYCEKKQVAE